MSGTPPRWGSPPPIYSPRGSPRPPFIPCPRPTWPYLQSPVPFSPVMWMPPPPSPHPIPPYMGVPLEPPGPLYQDHYQQQQEQMPNQDGRSTADIIAAQSQDYIDEKLAEYQATIYQLQGFLSSTPSPTSRSPSTEQQVFSPTSPTSSRSVSTESLHSLTTTTTTRYTSKVQVDIHIRQLKDEQERVQKKTFVNWINSYLQKRVPPLRIDDLIEDLKDGTKLLALLEVLSGEKLPTEKGRNLKRPHFLSNANTALTFLQSKRIKLVNINSSDLVDGRPPVVLGLIWTIILYFQIEENTRALASLGHNFGGSTSSLEGTKTPDMTDRKRRVEPAKTALLKWVTNALPKDIGLEVRDFGPSWRDGIAFLAIVDAIKKGLIDLALLRRATNRDRLETAFDVAERELGIARLLDPEDLDVEKPDEKSVMTYVAQFLHKYPELRSDSGDKLSSIETEYMELRSWLIDRTHFLSNPNNLPMNYAEYSAFESDVKSKTVIYKKLSKLVDSRSSISIASESWKEIEMLWRKLEAQMRHWLWLLDSNLPPPFNQIGDWLFRAENLLEDYDIPSVMNEETASIISRKLEEHKAFFADLPSVENQFSIGLSQQNYQGYVPQQQLDTMAKRLREIGPKAAVRRVRLKFLEHKCCLIAFMELTENKVRSWTIKYGSEQRVQQLLDQYTNFVSKNKIFQEFNKAFIDMQHVVDEYKRDGNIDQKECILVDRFMRDTSERWKGVCMELRCVQSMLEELLTFWKRWNTLSQSLEEWMAVSEPKLMLDEESRMEYFQDIGVWKSKHDLLGDTVSFLISTSEDQIAQQLKDRYLAITSRWEHLFSKVKQYMEAGEMLRHRREYRQSIEKLQNWLRNAESALENCYLDTTDKIKEHIQLLQVLQGEIVDMEELFKSISKTFQTLIQDLSREEVDKMMNTLKREKENIVKLRARLGMQVQLLYQVMVQQQSLETSQKEISEWLDTAEEFMGTLSVSGDRDAVYSQLERHKVFFSRMLYYKSMLESKNKALTSLLSSLKNTEGVDTKEFEKKMYSLNERFNKVSQEAVNWEQRLNEAMRGWQNYKEIERVITDWLQSAEKLMSEKHVESKQTVENHKGFFEHINERWIVDLRNATQALQKCLPIEEQRQLQDASQRLQEQFKKIEKLAPLHLIKMEFRLDEVNLRKYLKEMEKELNSQIQAFNKNENIAFIQARNQELLSGPMVNDIKTYFAGMERSATNAAPWPNEEAVLREITRKLMEEWKLFYKRAQEFSVHLQTIPDQWEAYRKKYSEMVKWMDSVDISVKNLLKELASAEEFEKERLVFQGICREVEGKREEMKWMVQTLDTLAAHSADANDEQEKLEQLILRYKKLIPVIEMTVVRTELYSKCYTYKKEVTEVCRLLGKVVDNTKTCDADSQAGVSRLVEAQEAAVAQLDSQRPNIVSMLQKGRDLIKEPSAPEFMKHNILELETEWNKAYNTTIDKLTTLKAAQKSWNAYSAGKSELLSLLEKAEQELRKSTPGVGGEHVAAELKAKQELCVALRVAMEQLLSKLQFLSQEISNVLPDAQKIVVREVQDLGNRLSGTLTTIEERIVVLKGEAGEWNEFDNGLERLNIWAVETCPSQVAELSTIASPQERLVKTQDIAQQANVRRIELDNLKQKAQILLKDKEDNEVAKRYLEKLKALEGSVNSMEQAIEVENIELQKGVATWQEFDACMQEVKPRLEKIEIESNMGMQKPILLSDAQGQLQKAKAFMIEVSEMKNKLDTLKRLSETLPPETLAANSVDVLQSKLTSVDTTMKQRANKLEKLVVAWQELEGTAQQLKEWLERPVLTAIVEKPEDVDTNIDLDEQLAELKEMKNELRKTQTNIVALGQAADVIASGLTLEGANLLKSKVAELKNMTIKSSDAISYRANLISEMLISREDLNSQVAALQNWLAEAERAVSKDVHPERVDSVLEAYHITLNEHSEKLPIIEEINERIYHAEKATPTQATKLKVTYEPLIAKYQDLADSVKKRNHAVEKWREIMEWSAGCKEQLVHMEYQLDSNQPIEAIEAQLVRVSDEIKAWTETCNVTEILCQESGVTLAQPMQVVFEELKDKEQHIWKLLEGKKAEKAQLGERWAKFQQFQENLSQKILISQSNVVDLVSSFVSAGQVESLINRLQSLNDEHKKLEKEKEQLIVEGEKLMSADKRNTVSIQNLLSSVELNWEKVNDAIKEHSTVLNEMNNAWNGFIDANERANNLIKEAETLSTIDIEPQDLTETIALNERSKKALEILKKGRGYIDTMDNKVQVITRLASAFPQFAVDDINGSYEDTQSEWQRVYNNCLKLCQNSESQIVILRQIEEVKDTLLQWLGDKNKEFKQDLENLDDPETVKLHLTSYQNELPVYQKLQESVKEKAQQLADMNETEVLPNLSTLNKLIKDEFALVQDMADQVQNLLSSFGDVEKKIKEKVKISSDTIGKIREKIMKCDNLTGDNAIILERLKLCRSLAGKLKEYDLSEIEKEFSALNEKFPSASCSTPYSSTAKEVSVLKKRYNDVLAHANKVENNLLAFLLKCYSEKLLALQRSIANYNEKISWCLPENDNDKHSLEAKLSTLSELENGISSCYDNKKALKESLDMLIAVGCESDEDKLTKEQEQIFNELDEVNKKYKECTGELNSLLGLWHDYDDKYEKIAGKLKDLESKIRSQISTYLDLEAIDDNIKDLDSIKIQLQDIPSNIEELQQVCDSIGKFDGDSRPKHNISSLSNKHRAVEKMITSYHDRLDSVKENEEKFNNDYEKAEQWITESTNALNKCEQSIKGKGVPQVYKPLLEELKLFNESKEKGQALINKAVESGEALFAEVVPENREMIRTKLRSLRDSSEALIDKANSISKTIEGAILRRNSFDDCFSQMVQWIIEMEKKFEGGCELEPNLQEKKLALHRYRGLAQDITSHQAMFKQLQEKLEAFADPESSNKLDEIIDKYQHLSDQANERVNLFEKYIEDHELFLNALVKSRDFLRTLINEEALSDRDGNEGKLTIMENLLSHKDDGEKMIKTCDEYLEVVLKGTAEPGHAAIIAELDEHKEHWRLFLNRCTNNVTKLQQLCNTWQKLGSDIDEMESWLKSKESQVKNQSLKSTQAAKQMHLEKLKALDDEIRSKSDAITALVTASVEAEPELADKASKLSSHFAALKNQSKEMLSRYEQYVKEHKNFDELYAKFLETLQSYQKELQLHSEVVGDLNALQEKQKKIRDINDTKSKDTSTYESILDKGEKLYGHTSPDGRELIRQQLKDLRNIWDSLSDDIQESMQKLDQCLLQFAEFTLAQEQLTKWLKDVEKAMQAHTGLKATLQEKKAQLQNHKIMHQEILGNQSLVTSVCDKAQQLVDQTKDTSLNVYLQSIKDLFDNIVTKSQDLLTSLENNVENHTNFTNKCSEMRDWLSSLKENINQNDDCTGEKADINNRIEKLKELQETLIKGKEKHKEITEIANIVRKATTNKGNALLDKEKSKLEETHEKLIEMCSTIQKKLEATLQQWNDFEEELDAHTKWFRSTEAAFRDQQMKATLEEKEAHLNTYKQKRNEITDREVQIDKFVDDSHALLHSSGVDRIKPLISQISNRYQLIHVLSKEVINRWQGVVDDHKAYEARYKETEAWLGPLEEKLAQLEKDKTGFGSKASVLQSLAAELEQAQPKLTNLCTSADNLYPDTAASGREIIRQQIRDIRNRWDALEEGIKNQQKLVDAHSMQWNSYQEALAQTLAWLDQMEKTLKQDHLSSLTSTQDIRSRLLKQKAFLQEVLSHKRVIESVIEKAEAVSKMSEKPMPETVTTMMPRYEALVDHFLKNITELEEYLDVVQVFNDLQKTHQDFQKQSRDRLTSFLDYSGNKAVLQARLAKVMELNDSLNEGSIQLKGLEDHVKQNKAKIPPRAKEAMERDIANLRSDFEKLLLGVSDAIQEFESRMSQWSEYQESLDRLVLWMDETEQSLKNYAPVSSLPEKNVQMSKYQELQKVVDSRSRELTEVVTLADHLEQALLMSSKSEEELDRLSNSSIDVADLCGESKISVSIQQVTSRFQAIQSTCKDIVKKCEQAVTDHESYNVKYKETSDWINENKRKIKVLTKEMSRTRQDQLSGINDQLKLLIEEKPVGTGLLNTTVDLAEKVYTNTAVDGKDEIRIQVEQLQQALDSLFDLITDLDRQLQAKISSWSGFEEMCEKLQKWLSQMEDLLPNEPELKATLDEKRNQLQSYRAILQDALSHQQEVVKLRESIESLPEKSENVQEILEDITKKHANILSKAQNFVEQYEGIVNSHQEYCKAVMEVQEWVEATHNTVLLWGDTELERVSLHTNLDRLKNLQLSLPEEEPRVEGIRTLAEKVLPGTIASGQANIRAQVDLSQQDWHSLLSAIQSTITSLETKLQQWSEYETLKDECLSWLRETDTKLHAIDLKATAEEKKAQLEILKALQGEIRAKELEIDTVTEKAQQLHKPTTRNSHITELQHKYQQLSGKVKDLTSRWQQYVTRHVDFDSGVEEASQWLEGIKTRLQHCSDLSVSSQKDLESKLETIQDLLLSKDEGFVRVQSCIEMGQSVLANTAPSGHQQINNTLENLQQEWSNLVAKIIDTKASLDECIQKWAGFLEQIQQLNKVVDQLSTAYNDVAHFQTTFSEKRSQLDKIKSLEEKVRCEKIEVDSLKAKSAEMLATGQQNHAATQAQQILQKFDDIAEKIKVLLSEREHQYREHRKYKEAMDELTGWLNRARERLPALKQQSLSDKLAIEDCVAPLQALLNKKAQGELLVEQVQTAGTVAAASSSEQGRNLINNDVKAITESFHNLFKDIQVQKEQLEAMVVQWRNYKDEYEKISDWLQQMDILIKAQKTALLATIDEKRKQVATVKDILNKLESGQEQIEKINQIAAPLLSSHLDTYVNNQLRHLNSRYEVQLNLAKDVLHKVETNCEQHEQYASNLEKTRNWLENAKEIIRESSAASSTSSKEVLEARLAQIQELTNRREEGQNLVHMTVNCGEKVLRNTRSDGREEIQAALKEIQTEWERLIKKISTAKVHLETSLLQWADYSSSYSQLQQWISDREAKLMEVCEQKVSKAKRGQAPGLSSLSIVERKATLRQTNSIVQDIVSFEPMIQSVTLKAEDLQQAAPASEITNKYETLSKTAKEIYEKQKETVEGHQAFIDAGNDFGTWLRAAKEKLSKCAEPTGDKESLATKLTHLKVLQNEMPEGQKKLETALQLGEVACALADSDDKEVIEEEVVLLQDEYDNYVENLNQTKALLENGIIKWTEYEDQYKEAVEWLSQTEESVQSFNKLQSTLEQKRTTLELFQGHLQTLFGWQQQLDNLNLKAQVLLETCADTRVSNAMMQLTTKYNALLSLAKEVMRRLELHYQEHQQHNSLYQECQQWVEKTREKVAVCSEMPNTIAEVNSRLGVVKGLQQALEQGQNRLRYALELKEKVILNTEQSGVAKIQEDSDSLKQEFEKLIVDVQNLRQSLTARGAELEDIQKMNNALQEWLTEMKLKCNRGDSGDISDTKAELEKFKGLARQIKSQGQLVDKLKNRLEQESIPKKDYQANIDEYNKLKDSVASEIKTLEEQVKNYDGYSKTQNDAVDWVRKTRIQIQQCSDPHGEQQSIKEKHTKLSEIAESFPKGEELVELALEKGQSISDQLGPDGKDMIKSDSSQLKSSLEALKSLLRDTQSNISKCLVAWDEFTTARDSVKNWLLEFQPKVDAESKRALEDVDSKSTTDLERVRALLDEINAKKPAIEDLSDKCEVLMEMSACNWVRDETVKWQGVYAELFTTIQELVSKVEKNLSDHTEFLKAKSDLEEWLQRAHGTVKDCVGIGSREWLKDRLQTVNLVTNRMTEGQHLMSVMEDVFKRALDRTPIDKQESLREAVAELHNSWEQLTIDLKSVIAQLNTAIGRWDDFYDNIDKMDSYLNNVADKLNEKYDTKAELSEMKTIYERLKHMHNDLMGKKDELERLNNEATELSSWANNSDANEKITALTKKWEYTEALCNSNREALELEMKEHSAYHQSLQDIEKWLLQVSFQLMAHNSLYITNKEQTQEQIQLHNTLLSDIVGYQNNLDDLRSKGYVQIEKYVKTTPQIKPTIEQQLTNVQESYNSLLHTAKQIKSRLDESLEKFLEYERTLESIMANLNEYETLLGTNFQPSDDLNEAKDQLEQHKTIHGKLQGEKTRLGVAVAACEAAAACISRPSSPQDPTTAPIPDQEINVRVRLEDLIDLCKGPKDDPKVIRLRKIIKSLRSRGILANAQKIKKKVEGRLGQLSQVVMDLEEKDKQLQLMENWIGTQMQAVTEWKNRPWKLRAEPAKNELASMTSLQNSILEQRNRLLTELPGGEHNAAVAAKLDQLEKYLAETLAKKHADENIVEAYRNECNNAQQLLDSFVKQLEGIEKGHSIELPQRIANLDSIADSYEGKITLTLGNIKDLAEKVFDIVSNLDAQQVEEQIKSIERRFNEVGKRIQRKKEVLKSTERELKDIENEIDQAKKWVVEKQSYLRNQPPIGFEAKASEERVQQLKNLLKEAEGKKVICDSCDKRLGNISNELETFEVKDVTQNIQGLKANVSDLIKEIKEAIEAAKEAAGERKAFEKRLVDSKEKLRSITSSLPLEYSYEPLFSSSVETAISDNQPYIKALKEFNEQEILPIQKQASLLFKECSEPERAVLQKIISGIVDESGDQLKKLQERDAWLKKLLQNRLDLEQQLDKIQQWLNHAEVALSGDVRASNLSIVQDQLIKYSKLNDECKQIKEDLKDVRNTANKLKLSDADRLTLNDNLGNLEQRELKVERDIAAKIKALGDALDNFKEIQEKIDQSSALIAKVKDRMKELSKPVGSKTEDVEAAINAYQDLLDQLKDWKNNLGDENNEALAAIHSNLQDMIKSLEDEIAHLRDLLRLRQQFIALINEIMTFITTYTPIVTEIEASSQSPKDKIRRYDDVLLKINDCEALLASATDKGEQIAAEGSAADQNSITEQLHSLKQQLQALRKAVENQRQKLLEAEQQHMKLAAELDGLLDWLHSHEGMVKHKPLLEIPKESVEREEEKHKKLAAEVEENIKSTEKVIDALKNEEGLPDTLQNRLSEAATLVQTLPKHLKETEQYLNDHKNYRSQYESLREKLFKWVEDAEKRLQVGKNGFNIADIQTLLNDHHRHFSDEKSLHDLVSIEIHKAGQSIWPSLNSDDQETISKSQQECTQLLRNTLNTAKSLEARLTQALELSALYKESLASVQSLLQRLKFMDDPVSALGGLRFNIEKLEQALRDVEHHQMDIDVLNERAREIEQFLDPNSGSAVRNDIAAVNDEWNVIKMDLESRKDTLSKLSALWEEFENEQHGFETDLMTLEDKCKHVETVVRTKELLVESKELLEGLLKSLESSGPHHDNVLALSKPILTFLEAISPPSCDQLQAKISKISEHYSSLTVATQEKLNKLSEELNYFTEVLKDIEGLRTDLTKLSAEVKELYVYSPDQDTVEAEVIAVEGKVGDCVSKVKQYISDTRDRYIRIQQTVPSDLQQKFTDLELLMENLMSAMEEKSREQKRARTVRTEYNRGKDVLQSWLQQAELKVQDKTSQPQVIKETLQHIQAELPAMQDKLEQVTQNAKVICENSNDPEEVSLITENVNTLTEQLTMIRAWIDEKKQQVGDSLDSWERFITLYNTVMNWVREKREFLKLPLDLPNLEQAKAKLHDYNGAVKSCKNMGKTLSEMSKELNHISENGSIGDLSEKMEEAETAKADVESQLLERNALLHEATEEWEQCEKKLREVRAWINKTKGAIEQGAGKKKPLRDQLATKEKVMADITIQKTKISVSIEKLQVHFKNALSGGEGVVETGDAMKEELDGLHGIVRQQSVELEEAINQVEQYQQELLQLKQEVVESEQKLRTISSPTYQAADKEALMKEQIACQEKVRALQSKISARTERVKLLLQRGTPHLDPLLDT